MRRLTTAIMMVVMLAGCGDMPGIEEPKKPTQGLMDYEPKKANGFDMLTCELVRVIDGDTIEVKFYAWSDIILQKTVRFEDIDTWEVRGEERKKGLAAKAFLEKLLATGEVVLQTERKRGKYGRLIGRIFVRHEDSVMSVAEELKKAGHEKK